MVVAREEGQTFASRRWQTDVTGQEIGNAAKGEASAELWVRAASWR